MTDFLTHILDKALDRAPLLQRRRASLFEPTPDSGGGAILRGTPLQRSTDATDWESSGDSQTPVSLTASATSHAESLSSFALPVPQSGTSTQVDTQKSARAFAPAENTVTRWPDQERQAPTVPRPLPDPRTSTLVNDTSITLTVQPSHALETIVEKIVVAPGSGLLSPGKAAAANEKHTRAESPASTTRRTRADLRGQREKEPASGVSRASVEKGTHVAAHARPVKPVAPPVRIPASHQMRAAVRPQTPEVQAAAPTINVTIGRIEVRATPAPSTPARTAHRAKSAPSLEDYLRSRSRGKR